MTKNCTFIGYTAFNMNQIPIVYQKLEAFIRKYYANELLRGLLFFIGLGLVYFLFTLALEYFLWLPPLFRTVLFWLFIAVEVVLFIRFIAFPLLQLFRLRKGLDYAQASKLIGIHFPEVSDKLTNFLQLHAQSNDSELVLASIQQKASDLQPVPFATAIRLEKNWKYVPLALIPIFIFAALWMTRTEFISDSWHRVVHHQTAFTPPAPYQFRLLTADLLARENEDFTLEMQVVGSVLPEQVQIEYNGMNYFMQETSVGTYTYVFERPTAPINFRFKGPKAISPSYELRVVEVPQIAQFEMYLQYPAYLKQKSTWVKGSGNATIPEGTIIKWQLATKATSTVYWTNGNQQSSFSKDAQNFTFSSRIDESMAYQIVTSNDRVANYEKLDYRLQVIKDQYPSIEVQYAPDSLRLDHTVLVGRIADDYGFSSLKLIYHPQNQPELAKSKQIAVGSGAYDQFVFQFPGELAVDPGVSYSFYFEVADNDALHGFKKTRSGVFADRMATDSEKQDQLLQQQQQGISGLQERLKQQEKQLQQLDGLKQLGKEKENLQYRDQQKIKDFLQDQKQQQELLKEFSKQLKENLEKFKSDEKDIQQENLEKRLEQAEKQAEQNQKLMEELERLSEKLQKDELFDKLDKHKQDAKSQSRNLEQLVELTKRFYVEKKAEQIADKIQELAEKQENLANKDVPNEAQEQQKLEKELEKLQEDMKELHKENEGLKDPMDIPDLQKESEQAKEEMQDAQEQMQKQNKAATQKSQKKAAEKLGQMSGQMQMQMQMQAREQMEEDTKALRQILDNLIAFSKAEEDVMKGFKASRRNDPTFSTKLKRQQDLRVQFKHIDDSLFALGLRNPRITSKITDEIEKVHYNVDKSLEYLADMQSAKGVSHQQYAVTSANVLADMLSEVMQQMLSAMSMSIPASGQGSGKPMPNPGSGSSMQLPDIIQKQQGIGQQMQQKMQEGKGSEDKNGQKPGQKPKPGQEGEKGKEGDKGKPGQQGKDGKSSDGRFGEGGEGEAESIMEIYKQQRQLREALEKELRKQGVSPYGQRTLDQMKQVERMILNQGFTRQNMERILNINYELIKLEKALQKQGEDNKRESQTNDKEFLGNSQNLPKKLQDYLNSIEILNRQALPLRPNFNQKVQEYFTNDD